MGWVEILRTTHIAAGALALVVFWLPLLLGKGSRWHRRIGWIFVSAMAFVSTSGLVLSSYRWITLPWRGARAAATFLAFISVLTGAGAWKGVRVLRSKRRSGASRHPLDVGFAAAVLLFGVAVAALGLVYGNGLLSVFGVIGVVSGASDLRYWLRPPTERLHWWYEHMADMFGTCIAALTAFTVQNAPRMGLGRFSLVAWLAPMAVLLPVLVVWQRYYRRRFGGVPQAGLVASPGRQDVELRARGGFHPGPGQVAEEGGFAGQVERVG
jgi:uncharacterized membrane protein